jgi:hypothetical protein
MNGGGIVGPYMINLNQINSLDLITYVDETTETVQVNDPHWYETPDSCTSVLQTVPANSGMTQEQAFII